MKILESLRFHLRKRGLAATMRAGASFLGRKAYDRRVHRVVRKRIGDGAEATLSAPLTVRRVSVEDLASMGFDKAIHYRGRLKQRESVGQICAAVFIEGQLAHVAWMDPRRLPVDEGLPDVEVAGGAGIYDMFTLEAFRRRGCQTAALEYLVAEAGKRGCRCLLATIHPLNGASLSVFKKCGFEDVGELTHRRWGAWTSVRMTPPLEPCRR